MLIWVDVETTGLDPNRDLLLEVGLLVTDDNCVPLMPSLSNVFGVPGPLEWTPKVVREMHEKNGLWAECAKSENSYTDVEVVLLQVLGDFMKPGSAPMAGSTISFDRAFLKKYMPKLEAFFHYRNVDVSTVKELCKRWAPEVYCRLPMAEGKHRVLADIHDSLNELLFYRKHFLRTATLP